MAYSYTCAEYPGMEDCPGSFTSDTQEELWKHVELHAVVAHQEDPGAWSEEERRQIRELIRTS